MIRPLRAPRLALFSCLVLAVAGAAAAGDWPQFRGPNRDGVSAEKGLLREWPADGPRQLWRVPIGEGYSGLVVAAGRLLTMAGQGSDELVLAYDAKTGRPLWRFRADAKYLDGQGNGPRSTPVVDGNFVYTLSARGKLNALDVRTGKPVWRHDLQKEFGAEPPQWGVSTTPLVEGNLLLVDVGGARGRSAMAFDKRNGKVVWASQDEGAGYSAPVAITVGGVRQALFFTASSLTALAPADGRLLWRVPWRTSYDVNAATPLFLPPDRVFVSSGYDIGAAVFRVKAGGGRASVEEVWRSRGMKNQFSSSVLHEGHIYGFDNATFKCLVAATGEERWRQRGFGHGSVLLADGLLYSLSDRGRLALVEATPQGYRERAGAQVLSGKCWTAPTLAHGVLYVRNEEELKALAVGRSPA